VQRETADTRKTSPDVQETKTTLLADGNGAHYVPADAGVAKSASLTTDSKRRRQRCCQMARQLESGRSKKKKTIRKTAEFEHRRAGFAPDVQGRLSEFSRTIGEETETTAGEKSNTIDTYSGNVPGLAWRRPPASEPASHDRPEKLQRRTTEQQVEEPIRVPQ